MQRTSDGKLKLGGDLTQSELKKLQEAGLTGNQILENIDDLNSEIYETANKNGIDLPKDSVPKTINRRVVKEKVMTLDEELEKLNNDLDNRKKQSEVVIEKEEVRTQNVPEQGNDIKDQILDLIRNTPGTPTQKQINEYKAKHGKNSVYAIGMGEGDVYIFTHLKRGQWKKIQEIMGKMSQQDGNIDVEDEMKKKVVQYCVLWPNPLPIEFFYNSRAGVLDAIYQSILLNSYFLTPQQTMMLTTQL